MTLFGRIKTVAPVWNGDTVSPQSVLESQREHKPTSTIQNIAAGELSRQIDQGEGRSNITKSLAVLAIQQTARWFFKQQNTDGHWRGPLEGDTILESEYLLICGWAGRLDQSTMSGCSKRILNQQLPDGGWAIYPGGDVDPSASVKAYLALKMCGYDSELEPLKRARAAIAKAGGPWTVNSFTRFYLALLGQISYSDCPAVPPEMILLPDWFPISLHRVSAWSRTMIVPLSLIWSFKPVRTLPQERGIHELFEDCTPAMKKRPIGGNDGWSRFFRLVDHMIKVVDNLGVRPLRRRAVMACREWMLKRFRDSDGLGAIFPPIVWSIVALRAMGCDENSAEVVECWKQLEGLIEHPDDETIRIEPCRSPVWDTAIVLRGLAEIASPAVDSSNSLANAVDWLLAREVRFAGDWSRRVQAVPSGWCFEYANCYYPDVDDTAMVLIAFSSWLKRHKACPDSQEKASEDSQGERIRHIRNAMRRGIQWLTAMQNSDGGWGAFDRDNNHELLCKVPFADHNAMIDPSSPDLTGRVLEAYGSLGHGVGEPGVDRAIEYLRETQEPDGSWFGRWGVNYIYGTWQAIEGLRAVGVSSDDPLIDAGVNWLISAQQPNGAWGESPASYADPALKGVGEPTASQTAWAVAGLVAANKSMTSSAQRGIQWLLTTQRADGDWNETAFTGTGFPKVFYLRYHYYRISFPLIAIARWHSSVGFESNGQKRMCAESRERVSEMYEGVLS
jgi:squalene-hopene/tetraprenyl-beta-curcumene cyclase